MSLSTETMRGGFFVYHFAVQGSPTHILQPCPFDGGGAVNWGGKECTSVREKKKNTGGGYFLSFFLPLP